MQLKGIVKDNLPTGWTIMKNEVSFSVRLNSPFVGMESEYGDVQPITSPWEKQPIATKIKYCTKKFIFWATHQLISPKFEAPIPFEASLFEIFCCLSRSVTRNFSNILLESDLQ